MACRDSVAPLLFHVVATDLTPSEPVALGGFANREGMSRGVHRPLGARVLALRQGVERFCLVAADLMELERETVETIRARVAESTGLAPQALAIHCTHTHSAPWMETGVAAANDRYIANATDRLVEAATRAFGDEAAFRPGRVRHGRARCDISAARELVVPPDGMPYRRMNPEAPIDREIAVVRIVEPDGTPGATLFNAACHPVVLGFASNAVSPDFPGRAREVVEEAFGGMAIFLNGAAGDVNPLEESKTDPAEADAMGARLGRAVAGAEFIDDAQSDVPVSCDLRTRTCNAALSYRDRNITPEFLESEIARKSKESTEFFTWKDDLRRWGDRMIARGSARGIGASLPVELTALRLGESVFLLSQGELFNHYARELKRRFPNRPVAVAGYCHGEIGYIPSAEAFGHGGYETDMAYIYTNQPSPLTPEAETEYLAAAETLIREVGS